MSDQLTTVQAIYEAFGRGDVSAILDKLSEEVRWEEWSDNAAQKAGVPWLLPRAGKDETRQFFAVVGGFTFHEFQILSLMEGGNQVVAELIVDATVQSGTRFRDEELHLWTFDESGKVARFRHYVDTAKHIAAM
jgi:ketosteroid isomerase-like protein